MGGTDFTKYAVSNIIYLEQLSEKAKLTSSPKGNDRSPESDVPRSNLI